MKGKTDLSESERNFGIVKDVTFSDQNVYVQVEFDDKSFGSYEVTQFCTSPPKKGDSCECVFGPDGYSLKDFYY